MAGSKKIVRRRWRYRNGNNQEVFATQVWVKKKGCRRKQLVSMETGRLGLGHLKTGKLG
ncbi:MAG: hypothetical protein PHO56_03325 [Patescibacteria group bacterium]|nr:hypothetical protein [Patescibacteria group bacterium]